LIDASARLENRREEAALAQLRDRQLEVAGLGREHTCAVSVALSEAAVGSFIRGGADHLGRLGLDQLLRQPLGQLTHKINTAIARAQRNNEFGQGRLIKSHRCDLLGSFLQEHTKNHADGSPAGGPTKPHHSTGLYPLVLLLAGFSNVDDAHV
jgi:hypothetical protein